MVTSIAQPASGSLVLTVRVNGVSSTVVVTIAAGAVAGSFSDTTHTVAVNTGDLISVLVVNHATATGANVVSYSAVVQ